MSDIDGQLSSVEVFDTTSLSNGTHLITFRLKGTNDLWSPDQTVSIDVNGRPVFGTSEVSEDTINRLSSAMFKVRIIDDNTDGSELDYKVSYRINTTGEEEWEEAYESDFGYNSGTSELEFTFSPDQNAPTGEYEFNVSATDEEGGVSDSYIMKQGITVQNNDPFPQFLE